MFNLSKQVNRLQATPESRLTNKGDIIKLLKSIKILTTGKFTVVTRKEEYIKIEQVIKKLEKINV